MDDKLKQRIAGYADKAYAAAYHNSLHQTTLKIAEAKARLASRGIILSGATVQEIAKLQGEHINTVVQAKADALLDAYELYGAEINEFILEEATALRGTLIDAISTNPSSGLPPGVPASEMFRPLLEAHTGAIINTIACQIEQRKVVPKFKKAGNQANASVISGNADEDRPFALMAVEEAQKSVPEDDRPHPKVGAVVVKNGVVVSKAHRGESPKSHAEYIALEEKLSDDLVAGATVYATLEPCTTRKHPKIPCVERLIERRVGRVVIGMLDPDPRITGRGQRKLRSANIITDFFPSDLMSEVEELNREFTRKFESTGRATDSPRLAVEPQAVETCQSTRDLIDKWVSPGYEHKSGVAKTLDEQGFDLGWVSADREAERVEFEGWEYVLVNQPDGSRARLKIHDHPAVGGYLILLKRRRPSR